MGGIHRNLGNVLILSLVEVADAYEIVRIGALPGLLHPECNLVPKLESRDHIEIVVIP